MPGKKNQKTKQGINRLSIDDPLFEEIEIENVSAKNFEELLEDSLSDKSEKTKPKTSGQKSKQGVKQLSVNDSLFNNEEDEPEMSYPQFRAGAKIPGAKLRNRFLSGRWLKYFAGTMTRKKAN